MCPASEQWSCIAGGVPRAGAGWLAASQIVVCDQTYTMHIKLYDLTKANGAV